MYLQTKLNILSWIYVNLIMRIKEKVIILDRQGIQNLKMGELVLLIHMSYLCITFSNKRILNKFKHKQQSSVFNVLISVALGNLILPLDTAL